MKGERIRDRARSRSAHAFDNIVRCIAPTVPAMLSRAGQPRLPPIPHVRGYGAARHSARKQRTPVAASAEDPAAIPSLPGSRQRGDADYVTHRVAMSGQYCFVCASNEGIFLDVTPDNQSTFGDQIETCLSSKISESIDLSNKICYKCAYELDQCTKFVQKYKKSHEVSEPKVQTSVPCCFLCYELADSDRIFDITKDNNVLFNPLQKIRSIFNDNVCKEIGNLKLICLSCRYNLDVLYDLRRVYQETVVNLKALINEEINYSNFPKVHTDVVNRKTTITTFPDITFCCSVHSSESDSNEDMARGKRHVKRRKTQSNAQNKLRSIKPKVRNCDNCYNTIANGIDMYRFYHTGLTVCKNCWITIDPSSDKTRRSRQIQSNLAEVKLCTVILTDVLSQELYKKKKIHQVEKNNDDNTSIDSSQEEIKSSESSPLSISFKTRNHLINGKTKKRKIDMVKSKDEYRPLKVTRLTKERINMNEVKLTRASVDTEQQSSTRFVRTKRVKRTINDRSSDSDSSVGQREKLRNRLNDRVNKTNKKKHKSIHEETTSYILDSSDETSNEDGISLKSKTRDATSSSNISIKKEGEEKSTRSRTRSSSISSIEISSQESKKSSVQSEVKIEYACDKCNKKFDTKLSNAKHRLTHLKQAALKLEKITVSSVKEKQETDVDSQDDKISIEVASRSGRTESADKQTDDPSEEIAINIEDDTEDEEIFSLVINKDVKEKTNTKISEENDIVTNKPDTAKSEEEELHLEEPKNDENIESKEIEQSTVEPDETLEIKDDEDRKNKNTRHKHTKTKTKSKTSANRDSDRSKDKETAAQETITTVEEDHNAGEEEDKNVEIENDEEVCSTEKEKISECNNDEEDFHEETVRDSETKSPILSSRKIIKDNKDHSESCENNLENNCDNDKDEIIEEPEISDLIDGSSKKDTKESEEVQNIDKTEIFNDEGDLDDTIIINEDKIEKLEERQNGSDEKNMEIDTVNVNESNDIQDTTEPELSNNEKHNEIKDIDENDIAAVPVNSDSNDDRAKSKKIMEEIVPTDDSKLEEEKEKFEEQLKELEEMVNDNAMNKHREVEENSTYVLDSSSADAANEILKEVFELAAAEVQHREENSNTKNLDDVEMETLENISREIRKSADMPSLDPISVMEMDDDILN